MLSAIKSGHPERGRDVLGLVGDLGECTQENQASHGDSATVYRRRSPPHAARQTSRGRSLRGTRLSEPLLTVFDLRMQPGSGSPYWRFGSAACWPEGSVAMPHALWSVAKRFRYKER